ncbi:RNB-domain-containing protein [Coemansia reversa NRRL 1564]|uniref:DIS3-like exonuclease 1 n=1 Tax=Coemansia reversa (strain ATCC 12441 / NRRL 1564) TaxID=763665 RepID=A0A2G5BCK1_COERN|nr:RNB-domain-containing protein [Coemansia reversa NRRL 1564]|eukprot:PIA16743.1 RNB-domain-containing protein [Coemansia reversa NRRL 1564]
MDITAQSPAEYAQGRLRAKTQGSYAAYYSAGDIEAGLRSGTLVRGKIRIHPVSSFRPETQGVVERAGDLPDIIITGRSALNRACSGDVVVVKLLAEVKGSQTDAIDGSDAESEEDEDEARVVEQTDAGEETPLETATRSVTGVVVGVVERRWRPYVATLQTDETGGMRHLAVPVDVSVPKIRIHYMDVAAISDRYFVVAIDGWSADSVHPQGHFVRALGPIGTLDAEIDTILVERQIAVSQTALGFSEASMREMPIDTSGHQWKPSAEEISSRRDLRSTLIFSIDPIGSQDIDDAVSMRQTKDGYELGVHIADVTQFVAAGSATDAEALARGTTVYLADRRFNMIPEVLSERVCSLRGGRDRYAVSVVWKLDKEYCVKDVWFGRSVIRSACEMSYEQAQALLDGQVGVEGLEATKEAALRTGVVELTRAMRVLRQRRSAAGALELASTEVKFGFESGTQCVSELAPKRSLEIHRVIEEAMVFANTAVARRIHRTLPSAALLRRHRSPTAERFERLAQAVRTRGFEIDSSSNAALATSLKIITQASAVKEPQLEFLAKAMATLAMQEAEYFATGDCASPAEFTHYGLAQEYYTHFTSPIRRYADIIVHRQLLAALEDTRDTGAETMALSRQWVSTTAGRLNERSRQSKLAQREATELFQSRYVAQKTADGQSLVADGVVAEVRTNGLIVYVPRFGLRGPVRLRDTAGQIRLPLSALTGSARDIDRFVDRCSDFAVEASSLSIRLPMDAPVFHLGSPVLRFAVFDRVKVALRVLETRRRRAPVFLTLVSRGAVGVAEAKAYRSTLAPLDRTLRVSATGRHTLHSTNTKDSVKINPENATALQSDASKEPDYYAVLDKFRAMSVIETMCDAQKL